VLDIRDYLRDSEVLKELVKKLGAVSQTINRLFTKVAKPHKAVLVSGNLRAVIKPEGGYVHKDWPFI
jgi:hypothetical protein